MSSNQIIGVAGPNGSGKDVVMEFLAEHYEYLFMSATDMLRTELEKRGLPTDRTHKSALSAEWRRQDGYGVIVTKAHEAFLEQATTYTGLVVGSLRHPAEADAIHDVGGVMIWVDADPKVRYDRIRSSNRGRVEDEVTYEQFMADEEREMHPTGDGATLNMAAVKEKCDITILNETDIVSLQKQIQDLLGLPERKV